jgi:hypothetical protein
MLILVSYIKPNKIPFDWEDFKTKISTSDEHVSLLACRIPDKSCSHFSPSSVSNKASSGWHAQ